MTESRDGSGGRAERRAARRLPGGLAATLRVGSAEVKGRIADLSRTGACIEGDHTLAELLLASQRRRGADGQPGTVQVCFTIPADGAGDVAVMVQARAVYVVHVHDDTYHCGLEFRLFLKGEAGVTAHLHRCGLPD